jgi:hypothetical protein
MNWVGILINLGFCLCIGWKRGLMDYESAFGKPTDELGIQVMTLYLIVTFLLIVSAVFLADALRRLKKSFNQDKRLEVYQKTMCLHIVALFIHTFFEAVAQIMIVYSIMT